MLPTRLLLSFVGFYLCYSISIEYDRCEYQVNVTIHEFGIENSTWACCWPMTCYSCTITAAILPKSTNQVNVTLLPDANVAPTLTTKFPAVNGSFPGIQLEFQTPSWSKKDVCVIKTDDDYYAGLVQFYTKIINPESGRKQCSAFLNVTFTLHCPATPKEETTMTSTTEPNVALFNTSIMMTMTSLTSGLVQSISPDTKENNDSDKIRTNTGNTTSTMENAKNSTMSTECLVLFTMMVVSYIIAIITITVEIVMCCKMYERTNKFPWCKVYLKDKVVPVELKAENVSAKEESVTMSSEQVNNPSQSDSSVTCGSEDQDKKVG